MYVQGVSTRKVAAITEALCGLEVTSGQVSRGRPGLSMRSWRSGGTARWAETPYLILDARYEKVRHGGQGPLVCSADGHRHRPGGASGRCWASRSRSSEAEVHWRDFTDLAVGPGPARGQAGRRRRPRRAEAGPGRSADRGALATVPIPSDEKCPGLCAQGRDAGRGGGGPAGDLRRPRPSRRRASAWGRRWEKYRTSAPRLADWAGSELPRGAVRLRPGPVAPAEAEDLEHAGAAQRGAGSDAPGWPGCSPTTPHCSAWSVPCRWK